MRAGYCPACAPGEIECPLVQNFFPNGTEESCSAALVRTQISAWRHLAGACWKLDAFGHLRHGASRQAVCRKPARLPMWARGNNVCSPQSLHLQGRGRAGKLGLGNCCNFPICTAPTSWKLCLQRSCRDRYHETPILSLEASHHNMPRLHRTRHAARLMRRRASSRTTLLTGTSQAGA